MRLKCVTEAMPVRLECVTETWLGLGWLCCLDCLLYLAGA